MAGRSLLLCIAGLAAMSCGETDGRKLPQAAPQCQTSVPSTVAKFVPDGQEVHCEDSTTFDIGRDVRLTHVEYGELRDCAAGCFASHVCAVEDPEYPEPLLFYASWNAPAEAPLGLAEACPDLEPTAGETWPDCVPTGLRHALVSDPLFRSFAEDEAGSGPLRWCVNRYVVDGSWP